MIDPNSKRADAPWRSAGIGMGMSWRCMGCNVSRSSTLGSKGAGVKKRCAVCVAAEKAQRLCGVCVAKRDEVSG